MLFDDELLLVLELVLFELEFVFEDPLLADAVLDELAVVEFPPFVVALLALFAVKCIFNVL